MRIASTTLNRYASQDLMKYQTEMADLQKQISSGRQLNRPSDDPVNASRQVNLSHSVSQLEQFDRNIAIAESQLQTEELHLANSEDILLRVRELALIANNAATAPEVYPTMITELQQLRADLLAQGNAKDVNGNYIFSGSKAMTQPFSPGDPDVYHGDDSQHQIQINQTITMPTGDSGKDIFLRIPQSNLSHTMHSAESNSGGASAVLTRDGSGQTPSAERYAVDFLSPTTYNITNLDTGAVVVTGATLGESAVFTFDGLQVTFTGTPAAADRFELSPTEHQNVFSTIDSFIEELGQPPQNSAEKPIHRQNLNNVLISVDQAFDHMTLKRADVGSRLASMDATREQNNATEFQLVTTLSGITDLDFADAISRLQQQATALEALQKSITRTQGLSLFNT